MNPEKRIERLTSWQVVIFAIPIVLHVIRLLRPFRELEGHLGWTLVRFGITVLAFVGVGFLEWKKRKIRKQGRAPIVPDQPSFDI